VCTVSGKTQEGFVCRDPRYESNEVVSIRVAITICMNTLGAKRIKGISKGEWLDD
jgi:hypothetical protein